MPNGTATITTNNKVSESFRSAPCLPRTPDHDNSLLPAASTTPQLEEAWHCSKHHLGTSSNKLQAPSPTTKVTPD
jgi:hypothetical protein